MAKSFSLEAIAQHIGAQLHQGKPDTVVTGIASLSEATLHQITFLDNPKYNLQLAQTKAGAVILAEKNLALCPTAALVVENPYLAYARTAQLFWEKPIPYPGIHPTAIVDATATVAPHVSVGPYAVIGPQVRIDRHAIIGAHCIIQDECHIGAHTELAPRVTLYPQVHIGMHCMIHSGAVLGSDGFGFAPGQATYEKIPQLGRVIIGNQVEIGANTTIDRGALTDTLIEDGVKLDNQIQIGHNVHIGANTVIAGCTGIAGSTVIGKNCMIGGGVGIAGHLNITDRVMLTGMATVTGSITTPGIYSSGTGLQPQTEWRKSVIRFWQLNQLAKTVNKLSKQDHA